MNRTQTSTQGSNPMMLMALLGVVGLFGVFMAYNLTQKVSLSIPATYSASHEQAASYAPPVTLFSQPLSYEDMEEQKKNSETIAVALEAHALEGLNSVPQEVLDALAQPNAHAARSHPATHNCMVGLLKRFSQAHAGYFSVGNEKNPHPTVALVFHLDKFLRDSGMTAEGLCSGIDSQLTSEFGRPVQFGTLKLVVIIGMRPNGQLFPFTMYLVEGRFFCEWQIMWGYVKVFPVKQPEVCR